jgi:hypothetical protein
MALRLAHGPLPIGLRVIGPAGDRSPFLRPPAAR